MYLMYCVIDGFWHYKHNYAQTNWHVHNIFDVQYVQSIFMLINHDIQLILLIFGLINFLIGYYDASKNAYANIE